MGEFNLILVTLGISVICETAAILIWGTDPWALPSLFRILPFRIGGASLSNDSVIIIVSTIVTLLAFNFFVRYTRWGRAMRATSIDRTVASSLGINVPLTIILSFVLSATFGGLAGALLTPLIATGSQVGLLMTMKGFAAAVLGGISSPTGAVAGGFLLGPHRGVCRGFRFVGLSELDRPRCADSSADGPARGAVHVRLAEGVSKVIAHSSGHPPRLAQALAGLLIVSVPLVLTGHPNLINMAVQVGIYYSVCIGLSLIFGIGGQLSLAQAAFYGLGAYTSAILSSKIGVPVLISIAAAGVLSGLVAWILATPILRLRTVYLAMATLAFGDIFVTIIRENRELTGGSTGIVNLPPPAIGYFSFDTPSRYYYLVWTFALIATWIARNLIRSRIGLGLRALADSEIGAAPAA